MSNKYHVITYGCQMNVHESEKIAGIFENLGYVYETDPAKADAVIFNTCCIRENAERRAEGNIGKLKKYKAANPHVIIGVVGCMTQQVGTAQALKSKFPFIDIILGTRNLSELHNYISDRLAGNSYSYINTDEKCDTEELPVTRTSRPNAWVNIIYGCNNFCTYCIVPYVRGRERSRDRNSIIREVRELLEQGYREITLLGQNVNSYGNDLGERDAFAGLLETIAKLPYKFRLKFMTSHPKDLSDKVIDVVAEYENIAKAVHLPMQSGSDRILDRMNRRYTSEKYLELVSKIKSRIPNVGLTTDIMVGFPGETEADFCDTLRVVEKAEFSGAFTFIYSRRSGTVADKMSDQIGETVKSERIGRLIGLQNKISAANASKFQGRVVEVLIENKTEKDGFMTGRTDCGRLVAVPRDDRFLNEFVNVEIEKTGISSLKGRIV